MIYDYKIRDIKGNEVSMKEFKDKVILIVNTATGCKFTPQYEGLQKLYDTYQAEGLEILDFPCNQFFEQAPGSDEALSQFCKLNFGTTFETFGRVDVNGENALPLYKMLKDAAPIEIKDEETMGFYNLLLSNGVEIMGKDIRWNFTKFLVSRDGTYIQRFAPNCEPEMLKEEIEALLQQ